MSSFSPIVTIFGREAIPVRALLIITNGSLGEEYLIDILMRDTEVGRTLLQNMGAYELIGDQVRPVPISEWCKVGEAIQTLFDNTNPNYPDIDLALETWKKNVIGAYPLGTFVWKDEFERAWQKDQKTEGSFFRDLDYNLIQDAHQFRFLMEGFSQQETMAKETKTRRVWNKKALDELHEKSIQPGATQAKLAAEYKTTPQNISKQLAKQKSKYGSNFSSQVRNWNKK